MSKAAYKLRKVRKLDYGIITISVIFQKGVIKLVDTELKEMFGVILLKLDSLDKKVDSLDARVDSLDKKVGSLDARVGSLDKKVGSLDEKVTQNSVEIESIKSDIRIIAEVQKAHMDQNERDHNKIIDLIDNKISLHSNILKKVSTDIRRIQEAKENLTGA
jgi:chromosome segregation ATPase